MDDWKAKAKRRKILDNPERTPEDNKDLEDINEKLLKIPVTENVETQKLFDQIRVTAEILKKEGKLKW